jgi:hypothetical protein
MKQNHSLKSLLVTACLCGASLFAATPAKAQRIELGPEEKQLLTTLFLGTTASLSIYLTQRLTDQLLDRMFADAHRYMKENAVALQQEVSFGGGPALEDLADIYRLPASERGAWGAHLREHSKELLPLLRGEQMTFAQAQTFTLIALSEMQLERWEQP